MFRVAVMVPTGVGAQLGGFAGDAGLLVRYLAGVADQVLTHPNVVNAAGFNVLPANGLYIEGYALNAFFQQEWGLRQVTANRIGLVIDRRCEPWLPLIENAVNATALSTGCQILGYQLTAEAVEMELHPHNWGYTGSINNLDSLLEAGQHCLQQGAEALAVLTWMDILQPAETDAYEQGQTLDPIGGLEALISHSLVKHFQVPVAHSPIFAPRVLNHQLDPRVAAEEIGTTYLPCVLMGLARAPRLVPYAESDFGLEGVHALVCPADACGNLPVLAALEHKLPVITLAENTTVLKVRPHALATLVNPTAPIYEVSNAWEAAGLLLALKQGLDPQLLRRPVESRFQAL